MFLYLENTLFLKYQPNVTQIKSNETFLFQKIVSSVAKFALFTSVLFFVILCPDISCHISPFLFTILPLCFPFLVILSLASYCFHLCPVTSSTKVSFFVLCQVVVSFVPVLFIIHVLISASFYLFCTICFKISVEA